MAQSPGLTRARVVDAAAAVADRGGITAVSMRNVGKELGVEAMSLYHHVPSKDALLDALADWAFLHIPTPQPDEPWRAAMVRRTTATREVLGRHHWTLNLVESRRAPGPALLRHHDAVLGCLLGNGFPVDLATHAFSVLDAYVYGFALTEARLPFEAGEGAEEYAAGLDLSADDYPHLARTVRELVVGHGFELGDEFAYGLDVILDELERRLARHGHAGTS